MANWPPLKSCCSLCLASLLSFTMATARKKQRRPSTAATASGIRGRGWGKGEGGAQAPNTAFTAGVVSVSSRGRNFSPWTCLASLWHRLLKAHARSVLAQRRRSLSARFRNVLLSLFTGYLRSCSWVSFSPEGLLSSHSLTHFLNVTFSGPCLTLQELN